MQAHQGSSGSRRQEHAESVSQYMREIQKFDDLTREEEAELVLGAQNGDADALDRLVTCHLSSVVRIAYRYRGRSLPMSDLIAEGNMGLIRSVRGFDPELGHRFITYAMWWIRQAIQKALKKQGHPVTFPVNQINDGIVLTRTANSVSQHLERNAALEEVAEEAQMSQDRARRAVSALQSVVSLDMPLADDKHASLADTFSSADPDPEEAFQIKELRNLLDQHLNAIPAREAKVVRLYFGLDGEEPRSLEGVGRELDLTRERVRQL